MPPEKSILAAMESWLASLRLALQSNGCTVELVTHTSLLVQQGDTRVLVSLGLSVAPHATVPQDAAMNRVCVELRARQYFVHGTARLPVPGLLAECTKLSHSPAQVALLLAKQVTAEPVQPYADALLHVVAAGAPS